LLLEGCELDEARHSLDRADGRLRAAKALVDAQRLRGDRI
jgi:hypothetical protein